MSTTSQAKQCPKCGGPIPAEAPQGLCPKCLLLQASLPTEPGKGGIPRSAPPTLEELAGAFPQLEILELIGQGGMGFVYKARQPKIDRFVALKILPQSLAADPAFAERFTREGRVLARLNHPNIVTIHDFGQANGYFYLLMEFVDGVNLRQAMKVGRFTPAQALAIVPRICEALQFAHGEGILHRDIKPENILLDSKGRVKIADFGIAKIVGAESGGAEIPSGRETGIERSSSPTGIIGTPQYMAPEQLEHPQDVDQRADIYSLGVVFYEMLTGELPVGRFAPPSEKSGVDPRMDEVVLRTLEKERARRTTTAGEVKTQVETIAASATAKPKASRAEQRPRGGFRLFRVNNLWKGLAVLLLGLSLVFAQKKAVNHDRGPVKPDRSAEEQPKIAGLLDKTIELDEAKADGDRVSAWTTSSFPAGEAVVAVIKNPDGSINDAMTQTMTTRNSSGRHITTGFSWHMPRSFGSNSAEFARLQLQENLVARPLTLTAGKPRRMFAVTNSAGGTIEGLLEFRPVSLQDAIASVSPGNPVQASVRFSRATNIWNMVLADFKSVVPPGHVLQAGAVESDGQEAEVSTSISRAANYDNESARWDFPKSFATNQMQSAVEEINRLSQAGSVVVPSGQRIILFSITNDMGRSYRGFLELLSPPSAADKNHRGSFKPYRASGEQPKTAGPLDKTIELNQAKTDGDEVSAWTASSLPAGEAVVAVIKNPDASEKDAMTQTMTMRDVSGKQVSTAFSWRIPRSFGSNSAESARLQLHENQLARPLTLTAGKPRRMFAVTNSAGGTIEGLLEFRPVSLQEAIASVSPGNPVQASVRFSRATNIWRMVLADFTSVVPPGHVLQAGAVESDGQEADVHTSIARSADYDGESARWDFPKSFTTNQMQSAVGEINRVSQAGSVLVPSGQRTILFSVTNSTGRSYRGFLELLSPPPAANK
jgi:serine/threonine protein kinase